MPARPFTLTPATPGAPPTLAGVIRLVVGLRGAPRPYSVFVRGRLTQTGGVEGV